MRTPEEREVDGWLAEGLLLLQLARPELDPRAFDLVWAFNPLLTSTGGYAYPSEGRLQRIELSAPLWPRASGAERRQIVLHELCHVLDQVLNGRCSGHGAPWQALMRALRLEPRRCHRVNTAGAEALA